MVEIWDKEYVENILLTQLFKLGYETSIWKVVLQNICKILEFIDKNIIMNRIMPELLKETDTHIDKTIEVLYQISVFNKWISTDFIEKHITSFYDSCLKSKNRFIRERSLSIVMENLVILGEKTDGKAALYCAILIQALLELDTRTEKMLPSVRQTILEKNFIYLGKHCKNWPVTVNFKR